MKIYSLFMNIGIPMYLLLNTVYGKNRLHIGYNGKVYCLNVILDVHNMMKLMLKHVHICDKLEV